MCSKVVVFCEKRSLMVVACPIGWEGLDEGFDVSIGTGLSVSEVCDEV